MRKLVRDTVSNIDVLNRKIDELETAADELLQLGITVLEESMSKSTSIVRGSLSNIHYRSPAKEIQIKAIRKYEEWYTASLYLLISAEGSKL